MTTKAIRVWGALTAVALVALAKLGLTSVALAAALTIGAASSALMRKGASEHGFVGWTDVEVRAAARTYKAIGLAPTATAGLALLTRELHAPTLPKDIMGAASASDLWIPRGLVGALATITATIYLSSLIDWCLIVPRLRGGDQGGAFPCRRPSSVDWRGTTQLWLTHRTVAFTIVRLTGLAFLAIAVAAVFPQLSTTAASLLGAIALLIAAYFVNKVLPITGLMTNPPFAIGDRITLAEEFGTGVETRPAYYVADAAVEGFALIEVDENDRPCSATAPGLPEPDRTLDLGDVMRLLRGKRQFGGCTDSICLGVNRECPRRRAPSDATAD